MSNEAFKQSRVLTPEEKQRVIMFYEILMNVEQRQKKAQQKKEASDAKA